MSATDALSTGPRRFLAMLAAATLVIGGVAAFRATGASSMPSWLGNEQETASAPQEPEDPAIAAYRSGRYDEAIDAFRSRIRDDDAPATDHRGLVEALAEVGRYEEAEEAARAFISAHPDSPELFNVLGEVLDATGRLDDAEEAFRSAISGGASDDLTAEVNLAVAAFERGRRDEAMQRFDRFIDVYNAGQARTADDLAAVGIACRYLGIDDYALFHDSLKALDEAIAADPSDPRPRLLAGALFLEKYDSAEATPAIGAVLEMNPNHPGALVAMARLMEFDGQAEAFDYVDRALETNPNLVAARVFKAHQALAMERFAEAAKEAQRALEINPASLEALAALATAHYLGGDSEAFKGTRDRALGINPRYGDLYNTLADLAVQNRLYAQAVEFAQQAIAIDPQSWRAYSIVGVNQLRIGAIEEGRSSLETAFGGDPFNLWVMNTLDLLDTFVDYDEIATERFELMIEKPEAKLLALYVGALAEEAYDYFSRRYRYEPPTPIRLEVYPSHADFSVRTVGLAGLGALGVSFGPVIAIDSPSARTLGEFNWGSTVWHEIGHTFTLGMTDFRIPRWFSEGLSVYEERLAREGWGDDVTVGFLVARLRDQLLPTSIITDGFMRPTYPQQVANSYLQAGLICELIEREWGFEAILGLLDAYRTGQSTEDAFRKVIGVELDEFDETFFAYLDELYAGPLESLRPALARMTLDAENMAGRPPLPPSPTQLQSDAESNPDDFLAQLGWATYLYQEGRYDEARSYLERSKDLFPGYAEANSPYWYLAMIAKEEGDPRRAIDELGELAAINEKHYQANIELAGLHEALREADKAAEALERIVYIYPLEIEAHQRLAGLYEEIGVAGLTVRERQAVVALEPVDMAEALYQLARAQVGAGDLADAKRSVLGALEIAPGFPAAQDLLLAIVERGNERQRP